MSNYAKIDDNNVVVGWYQIKEKIGTDELGADIFSEGFDYPNEDITKMKAVPNDVWENRYTKNFQFVINKFVEYTYIDEMDAERAKVRRGKLLADSDWTQMGDLQMSPHIRAQWSEYRQALRDITSQDGFPTDIIWPQKP